MDRKSKVEHRAGDNSANGENRTKEEALGKIHQMEWMRNKKEPWHLARSNSKGENVQEKKKYSKEEDNYFEGTGSQKTKKFRKPRHSEGHPQSTVPHGFSLTTGPCGPPPVNAWSQKKGSALFSKPSEEVDEEDEMLKLALEESLKTAEEDKKRLRERERRLIVEAHSSIRSKIYAEKEYEEDLDEEETYRTSPVCVKQAQTADLFVVETDPPEETISPIAKKKSPPFRARTTSVPHTDEYSAAPVANDFGPHKYPQAHEKFPPARVANEDSYEVFEPSRPHKRPSPPVSMNNTSYDKFENSKPRERSLPQPCVNDPETSKPMTSYLKPPPKHEVNRAIMIPEKDETISSTVSYLSTSLKSTLTFGDTQGLLENDSSSLPQDSQFELNEKNKSVERAAPKSSKPTSSSEPAISVETTDTDYMLHRFIRHDPPSSLMTDGTPAQIHESSNDMFTLNSSQQYLPSEFEQFEQRQQLQNGSTSGHSQLAMSNNSGQDSSSSMSDSPLQNVSPYGSFEKQMPLGVTRGLQMPNPSVPFPFPYPLNVQGNQENTNNLQAMQLTNRNFPSQMPYPNIPPGYIDPNNAIRGMIPLNPQLNQMPGLPQYSPSNLMMNSLQGQDYLNLTPQIYHHHLHLLAMNAANQYQQQLAALNIHETMDSVQKEQTNTVSQPQIPNQNDSSTIQAQSQPQLIPPQNQPQIVPIQNLPQMIPVHNQPQDISSPKQEWFPGEYQQQVNSQNKFEHGMPQNAKSKEELIFRYEQTLQTLNQLKQQLVGPQLQSCPIQIPQPQSYAFPTYPMAMGTNNFYQGRPVPVEAQQHLNQHMTGSGQSSPNTPQDQLNMPGLRNMTPELIHTQVPLEPQVGRGRGRIL